MTVPEGREYELKLEIKPQDVDRLLSSLSVKQPAAGKRLCSTYFDTANAALHRCGISLRVRRAGSSVIHTVKRTGLSIVDRQEWEREDARSTPSLAWLRTTPLKRLFNKKWITRHLQPRFTVDVERSTFALSQEGAEIEGALDRGSIATSAGSLPISEFELELKTGDPKAILALARNLARDVPLVLSLASKSERGYRRTEPAWGKPTKTLQLQLRRSMSLAEAFEATTLGCLKLVLANVALIGTDEDAEAVHKARIALRRLRAAVELFKPVMRRRWSRTILLDIKWMAKNLGEARDTDVFLEQAAQLGNEDDHALIDVMRAHQQSVRDDLNRELASSRWRLLLLDLLDASRCGLRRGARDRPLRPYLHARLASRRRALVKRSRNVKALPSKSQHDVRKRAKMLRYTCDFAGLGLVRRPKAFKRLRADLQVLQETLGTIHDGDALRDRLRNDVLDSVSASPAVTSAAQRIVGQLSPPRYAVRKACRAARRIRRL